MLYGFPPIESIHSTILILGTGPSIRSALKQQYYGHERNAFWPIMHDLLGGSIETYEQKWELLLSHNVALWDVLSAFERKGSADSAFTTVIPNDFERFFLEHPAIQRVLFNGKKAQEFYQKLIGNVHESLTFLSMPSTSPAYTLSYEEKRKCWESGLGLQ
ncbi:MAG: DNA-deoxyinosine glycosylase [Sphaerochaetaceae bacterium]